jgi:hypothetical protein
VDQHFDGRRSQGGNVISVDEIRRIERVRQEMDRSQVDRQQQNVGDIDLPYAPHDPRRSENETALARSPGIDDTRRIAGNEDKQVGTVAEAVLS